MRRLLLHLLLLHLLLLAGAAVCVRAQAAAPQWGIEPSSGFVKRDSFTFAPLRGSRTALMFGGASEASGVFLSDVKVLNTESFLLHEPDVTGTPPQRDQGCGALVSSDAFVYFGGGPQLAGTWPSNTFTLDLRALHWSSSTPSPSPPGREKLVCTGYNDRYFFIHGGVAGAADFAGQTKSDTWRFDVQTRTWTQLDDFPVFLYDQAAARYENKWYIHGGTPSGNAFDVDWATDMRVLNLDSGLFEATLSTSYGQFHHAVAVHGPLFYFTGGANAEVLYFGDPTVRVFNASSQQFLPTAFTIESLRRYRHEQVVTDDGRLVVHGGIASFSISSHVLQFKLDDAGGAPSPLPLPTTAFEGPAPHANGATAVAYKHYVIVAGGHDESTFDPGTNRVSVLDTYSHEWSAPTTTGTAPPALFAHAAGVFNTNKMLTFGGRVATSTRTNAVHVLDLVTFEWSKPDTSANSVLEPTPTEDAACAFLEDRFFYCYGGHADKRDVLYESDQRTTHMFVLDTQDWAWRAVSYAGAPPALRKAGMVGFHGRLFLFGGDLQSGVSDELWVFTRSNNTWTKPRTTGTAPIGRKNPAAALLGAHMAVFGGDRGSSAADRFRDYYFLDLETFSWASPDATGSPGVTEPTNNAERRFAAAAVGDRLYVHGGLEDDGFTCVPTNTTQVLRTGIHSAHVAASGSNLRCMGDPEEPCLTLSGAARKFSADAHNNRLRGLITVEGAVDTFPHTYTTALTIHGRDAAIRCVDDSTARPCLLVEPSNAEASTTVLRGPRLELSGGVRGVEMNRAVFLAEGVAFTHHSETAVHAFFSTVQLRDSTLEHNGRAVHAHASGLHAEACRIANNSAGGVYALLATVTLREIDARDNSAATRGGALEAVTLSVVSIVNSTFRSCRARAGHGGAVFTDATTSLAIANGTLFDECSAAGGDGGAVYAASPSVTFGGAAGVAFARNRAPDGGGGALFLAGVPLPSTQGVVFLAGNEAAYGADAATPPRALVVESGPAPGTAQTPGVAFSPPVVVALHDAYQQVVRSSTAGLFAVVSPTSAVNASVVGRNIEALVDGRAAFNSTGLQSAPLVTSTIELRAVVGSDTLQMSLDVEMAPCGPLQVATATGCVDFRCPVELQVITDKSGALACRECPRQAARCGVDGQKAESRDGFWIFENAAGEVTALPCAAGRCLDASECGTAAGEGEGGSSLVQVVSCCGPNRLEASQNPLCALCARGYDEWGGECVECRDSDPGLIITLVAVLWILVILFHVLSQTTFGHSKIFFTNVQLFSTVLAASSPGFLQWMSAFDLNIFGVVGDRCVVSGVTRAVKYFLPVLVPLFCLGLLLLTFVVHVSWWWLRNRNRALVKFHKSPYIRTLTATFILTFNANVTTVLRFWHCVDVGDGRRVIAQFPAITCDSREYGDMKPAVISLIVLLVALSVAVGVRLRWAHLFSEYHRRKPYKMKQRYGVIYECYRSKFWFWELVVALRRALIIGAVVIWIDASRSTLYTVLSVLNLTMLLVHVFTRPYIVEAENIMETLFEAALLLLTMYLGSIELPFSDSAETILGLIVLIPIAAGILFIAFARYAWQEQQQHRQGNLHSSSNVNGDEDGGDGDNDDFVSKTRTTFRGNANLFGKAPTKSSSSARFSARGSQSFTVEMGRREVSNILSNRQVQSTDGGASARGEEGAASGSGSDDDGAGLR